MNRRKKSKRVPAKPVTTPTDLLYGAVESLDKLDQALICVMAGVARNGVDPTVAVNLTMIAASSTHLRSVLQLSGLLHSAEVSDG